MKVSKAQASGEVQSVRETNEHVARLLQRSDIDTVIVRFKDSTIKEYSAVED